MELDFLFKWEFPTGSRREIEEASSKQRPHEISAVGLLARVETLRFVVTRHQNQPEFSGGHVVTYVRCRALHFQRYLNLSEENVPPMDPEGSIYVVISTPLSTSAFEMSKHPAMRQPIAKGTHLQGAFLER